MEMLVFGMGLLKSNFNLRSSHEIKKLTGNQKLLKTWINSPQDSYAVPMTIIRSIRKKEKILNSPALVLEMTIPWDLSEPI